ncbi:MAG: class I SAM-dependent methyltransferase [Lachnospiraceae bacterium]|nr:class I SAM-dependent methyltransferase [Lachnospiraceae bacterium]
MKRNAPPKLSERLRALVSMLKLSNPHFERAADIGCDHGWIAISLILEGIAEQVIASDIRPGPLERAIEHIAEYGLEDRIRAVLSGGMEHLSKNDTDAALIAGMGGFLIRDILEEAAGRDALCDCLVLQPQNGWDEVRRCLGKNGYDILHENMVCEDGKFYVIMGAKRAAEGSVVPLRDLEEKYGPVLLREKHPVLLRYLENEHEKFAEVQRRLLQSGNPGETVKEKLSDLERALDIMNT